MSMLFSASRSGPDAEHGAGLTVWFVSTISEPNRSEARSTGRMSTGVMP